MGEVSSKGEKMLWIMWDHYAVPVGNCLKQCFKTSITLRYVDVNSRIPQVTCLLFFILLISCMLPFTTYSREPQE